MKKIISITLVIFSFLSCESDDFYDRSGTEVGTISFANLPDELVLGNSYQFDLSVDQISDCHSFNRFETEVVNENTIVVGAILNFNDNLSCESSDDVNIRTYDYEATTSGTITFRFLSDNTPGNQDFIEHEVTVLEP